MPNGSDHNAGYECDRNHGIGRTNPAHTGCTSGQQPVTNPGGCTGDMSRNNANCGETPPGNHADNDNDHTPVTTADTPASERQEQPAAGTVPAKQPVAAQKVLGARAEGSTPATAPTGASHEVLAEHTSGSVPATAAAPAAAQRSVQAGNQGGTLPFTGTDALLILFLGCLMVLGGVTLQRVLVRD